MRKIKNIISSNIAHYQSILEIHFVSYLEHVGSSVKTQKNYRSDLNHFFSWIMNSSFKNTLEYTSSIEQFVSLMGQDVLAGYRNFLLTSGTPTSTINRRLSSIRIFFECCKHYGWLSDNPAKSLLNVQNPSSHQDKKISLLTQFAKELESEGASQKTIKNYVSDVKQFLFWLDPITS